MVMLYRRINEVKVGKTIATAHINGATLEVCEATVNNKPCYVSGYDPRSGEYENQWKLTKEDAFKAIREKHPDVIIEEL